MSTSGITFLWLSSLNTGWDHLSCNGLWAHMISVNFLCFSIGHWQSPCKALMAGKCLPLVLCKETVKQSNVLLLPCNLLLHYAKPLIEFHPWPVSSGLLLEQCQRICRRMHVSLQGRSEISLTVYWKERSLYILTKYMVFFMAGNISMLKFIQVFLTCRIYHCCEWVLLIWKNTYLMWLLKEFPLFIIFIIFQDYQILFQLFNVIFISQKVSMQSSNIDTY